MTVQTAFALACSPVPTLLLQNKELVVFRDIVHRKVSGEYAMPQGAVS